MAALLFLWSLLGCGVGESHPSQVTDTRVVAVVATPPVPAPGDRVALEIYTADPKARGLELLVWSCTPLGGEPCVESTLGANERVFVSTDHAEGRFEFDAPIPAQLAELAAQNGIEAVEARLWFLACAPELCPIIGEARRALEAAEQGDPRPAERLADDLAEPQEWLRELPLAGVSLASRALPVSQSPEGLNSNPILTERFRTEEERDAGAFRVTPGDARSLRFRVEDGDGHRTDAYAYTTVGRFDDDEVRETTDDGVFHWLIAPEEPTTGRVWVVVDDDRGGRAVWTQPVEVR